MFLYADSRWEIDFDLDGIPNNHQSGQWGQRGDLAFAGDFDGNGQADLGLLQVYAGTWLFDANGDWQTDNSVSMPGAIGPGDYPVTGDFNHDGITDIAAFRAAQGFWFIDYGTGDSMAQSSPPVTVTFNPTSIEAVIVEEPTTGSDEIYIFYSLHAKHESSTQAVHRAWGVYAMTTGGVIRQSASGQGQWLVPLTLETVANDAEIWLEVRVMESENDERAREIIRSVNANDQAVSMVGSNLLDQDDELGYEMIMIGTASQLLGTQSSQLEFSNARMGIFDSDWLYRFNFSLSVEH